METQIKNYKDNVFCIMHREKKHLLPIYNYLNGSDYHDPEELQVVTLEQSICIRMHNDAAFLLDGWINLYEQQASVNPNMPLRFLLYIAEEYRKLIDHRLLYRKKALQIPSPHCVVFYNGTEKQPEVQTHYLSELYGKKNAAPDLELKVTVYNINPGYNEGIMEASESLRGYMTFVGKVRQKVAEGIQMREAVPQAVEDCIREGVMAEFFKENREEIVGASIWEFDQEMNDWAKFADGEEYGFSKGMSRGISQGISQGIMVSLKNLMESTSCTIEQAMKILKIPGDEQEFYRRHLL